MSIDFVVILVTMAHPNKWTIVNKWVEKRIHKGMFLDKFMPDATLAGAQTLRLAFLQISDIWWLNDDHYQDVHLKASHF